MPSMSILTRSRPFISKYPFFKSISTVPFLSQHPQLLSDDPPPPSSTSSPPPPPPSATSPPPPRSSYATSAPPPPPSSYATSSPPHSSAAYPPPQSVSGIQFSASNWRNPNPNSGSTSFALSPLTLLNTPLTNLQSISQSSDAASLMNLFADWMTSQRWNDMKNMFEVWIRCLDKNGKPNKPDVGLYNHYLRANLMIGASAGEMLDLVGGMEKFGIVPNTASFNLVLKAMAQGRETNAAEKLLERMLLTGKQDKESLLDEASYDLVIGMLFATDQIESALKYIDLSLKSGYMLSMDAFTDCVRSCVNQGRLDLLLSIIERCKKMDENKALCPPWAMCNYIADIAMQADNPDVAYYALESMAKWIARGEIGRPPLMLSVNEGLVISALATAGRTCSSKLLDGSWAILKRSLRQKKHPSPESYLGKIYAHASLGSLPKAFNTLRELEKIYGNSTEETSQDLFSPFTSLNPLVLACSKNGFATLDLVYFQLENLSKADPPYKSVAALNCVILGCANIWDVDRAYQTFSAIDSAFGLSPNIHSYNALISAFMKHSKTEEAMKVFEHFVGLGLKPDSTTYSLLIDGHLIKRDLKAAISTVDDMVIAGFGPTRETLQKIRRRCIREMDYESNDKLESYAKQFNIRMGLDTRRNILFNLEYSTDFAG